MLGVTWACSSVRLLRMALVSAGLKTRPNRMLEDTPGFCAARAGKPRQFMPGGGVWPCAGRARRRALRPPASTAELSLRIRPAARRAMAVSGTPLETRGSQRAVC